MDKLVGSAETPYSIVYNEDTLEVLGLLFDQGSSFVQRTSGEWDEVEDDSLFDHPFVYVTEDSIELFDNLSDKSGTIDLGEFYEVLS